MDNVQGLITDIQRFSVHDGFGIRTAVFFKGCNMRCLWCHNPETILPEPELMLFPEKCLGCGKCELACKYMAISDLPRCTRCFACVDACYAGARVCVGNYYSPDALMKEILLDLPYYGTDGGVTFTGGEPFLQNDFLTEMSTRCLREGVRYAVETNLSLPWEQMHDVLKNAQLVMCDIKAMDDELHKSLTGISNRSVLKNIALLSHLDCPIIVRTPVLMGINDGEVEKVAAFLAAVPRILYYELLPYNPFAEQKWRWLSKPYTLVGQKSPSKAQMAVLRDAVLSHGVKTQIMGV